VTIWQFQQFIKDNGYIHSQWWPKGVLRLKSIQNNSDYALPDQFHRSVENQPIVGVSWYEAAAFCHWLSARARKKGWLGNFEIRLPTEAEWEVAASWDLQLKKRRSWKPQTTTYWQHTYDATVGKGGSLPVGLFPQGASPSGALDMAGNVWEWCSSGRDGYPVQAHVLRKNVEPSARDFVLRGGSWRETGKQSGWSARSVASNPDTIAPDRGFRVFLCSA
jgi:formylglycine-generating enzyme required for sulfatase activity